MESLRNWAYSVGVISVFGTLVEAVMPAETYRKYVHIILGMLLLLTLTRPFIGLFSSGSDLSMYLDNYAEAIVPSIEMTNQRTAEIESMQKEDVIRIYKQTLENNIKVQIAAKHGVEAAYVEVVITDDGTDYGRIKSVSVGVTPDGLMHSVEIRETVSNITGLPGANVELLGA